MVSVLLKIVRISYKGNDQVLRLSTVVLNQELLTGDVLGRSDSEGKGVTAI